MIIFPCADISNFTVASVAVESGLRISFLMTPRLTVKLFNLMICWELPWSFFPSSLIYRFVSLSFISP